MEHVWFPASDMSAMQACQRCSFMFDSLHARTTHACRSCLGAHPYPTAERKYPPPLAQTIRLHKLLLPGRLDVTYTGGGCLLRRLPRCKGRYVVCVPESDWPTAEAALAQLPPPTVAEAERKQQKQQQQHSASQLASGTSSDMTGGEAGSGGEAVPAVPGAAPA